MARKKSPTLTDGEHRLMAIIWKMEQATVAEVVKALPENEPLAYNTVLTTMRILENKGYLKRIKSGRAHIYCPLVSASQARRKVVRHVVQSFFNGSPELLLLNMIENEAITDDELQRLKDMIEKKG